MLKDVVEVRHAGGHRLYLRFEDGVQGTLDFSRVLRFRGVFAPLRDQEAFAQARVDPEIGTVVWPGGADLAPEVLYERLVAAAATPLKPRRTPAAKSGHVSVAVSRRGSKIRSNRKNAASATFPASSRSARKRVSSRRP